MRHFITAVLLTLCLSAQAQTQNLKLHYDFSSDATGAVKDMTGNGYDGTLRNHAFLDQYGNGRVLNMGLYDGYLDMGAKTGELISTLQNFSISTYVAVDAAADLSRHGNFIWSFANSTDIIRDQNGAMFLSAGLQRYAISISDFRGESGIGVGAPLPKSNWKHVVYTQAGTTATLYVDGAVVLTGTVTLYPSSLGRTAQNFIGRSPYSADAYLRGLLSDFRIYDKALTPTEVTALGTNLSLLNGLYADYVNKPTRLIATGNPLFSHKYTADPAALVHNDVFYLYAGQDTGNGNSGYNMPNWVVFSTEDMETWYEYPIPLRTSDFSWAIGNNSWASQVIERNGKFYWYVSTEHASVPGKAIGVAVSDSPTGPFSDARGSALVTNNMTTQWTNISWDDIDPSVWIDDDGQAYLFWGNSQCYYAKLKANMTELDGPIMPVHLPAFTEAPWIHKRGEWYYLSYATGWPERIAYAMSKNINGPWEYKGILNSVAGNSNTNHQAIVEYKDKWYFVYHNGGLQPSGGSYLRSVCIDYLYYNDDNTLKRVIMTDEGVDKITNVTSLPQDKAAAEKVQVQIYPNPATDVLNIDIRHDEKGKWDIAVYNLLGVKMIAGKVDSQTSQLNIATLPKGFYVVRGMNDKGWSFTSKIKVE